ncbi:MAG: DUF2127 domain-containing protein [Acidobacteriota bacterium]
MIRSKKHRDRILAAIALFKFVKSALLLAGALSAWQLIDPHSANEVKRWLLQLPSGLEQSLGDRLLAWLTSTSSEDLRIIGLVLLGYATLFTTEGTGLWLQKRWAEYLTLVATASFLPFEIYEIVKVASFVRIAVLVANIAVIGYLIWKVRQK